MTYLSVNLRFEDDSKLFQFETLAYSLADTREEVLLFSLEGSSLSPISKGELNPKRFQKFIKDRKVAFLINGTIEVSADALKFYKTAPALSFKKREEGKEAVIFNKNIVTDFFEKVIICKTSYRIHGSEQYDKRFSKIFADCRDLLKIPAEKSCCTIL